MLSDVLNDKIRELQAQQELAMGCCCNECETTADCGNEVTFYFATSTTATPPMVGDTVNLEVVENNLRCVRENCYVMEEVTPPCGDPFECQVCLSRFRYVGCIKYLCNIPTGNELVSCFNGCEFIDRIRCYTCANDCETQCPTDQDGFIDGDITATVTAVTPILDPNDNVLLYVVTVSVTFDLTSPCTLLGVG